jgi:nucleoside 2-deoxyribosyltransferase
MDKRFQVFVSSTFEDLIEARKEIIQALLELDCIPAGMELFPAADDDQWTLIKRVIDDCDYYLVVIGGRYGSIGANGMSYTQMEYEYAVAQGKPVLAFLHKDPSSLPAKYTEKTTEGREKLDEFRTIIQNKMCKYWTTPADLGSVVSRSLIKLIKNNPAVGWVKADLLPDQSTAEEMLKLRKRIEMLEMNLLRHAVQQPMIASILHKAMIRLNFGLLLVPSKVTALGHLTNL